VGPKYLRKNKAFSLLELVISIAILEIGVTAALQAFSAAMKTSALSGDIINAVFLAEDKIQELEFKERMHLIEQEPAEEKNSKGKFEWQYSLNLNKDLNLYELSLDIFWGKLNPKNSLKLNTYLRK